MIINYPHDLRYYLIGLKGAELFGFTTYPFLFVTERFLHIFVVIA